MCLNKPYRSRSFNLSAISSSGCLGSNQWMRYLRYFLASPFVTQRLWFLLEWSAGRVEVFYTAVVSLLLWKEKKKSVKTLTIFARIEKVGRSLILTFYVLCGQRHALTELKQSHQIFLRPIAQIFKVLLVFVYFYDILIASRD